MKPTKTKTLTPLTDLTAKQLRQAADIKDQTEEQLRAWAKHLDKSMRCIVQINRLNEALLKLNGAPVNGSAPPSAPAQRRQTRGDEA